MCGVNVKYELCGLRPEKAGQSGVLTRSTFSIRTRCSIRGFFEGFGEDFLSAFFSGLAMGLGSYGMGGDFNTGYSVGAMSELSKQAYRDAVLPSNERHIHAFGRCFVDEAFIYVVDVNSCDRAFIKVQHAEASGEDMMTKQMTSPSSETLVVFRKSVEYDKCRDWALELHKRKLQKCEEFTNREQMPLSRRG